VGTSELWLIRHAESVWNAQRRWQGQADPPLSPLGVEQARRLGARLAAERIERVVASDLCRALETARQVAVRHGLEPVADPRLRELDVGRWEGRRRAEIERFDGPALLRFDRGDPRAPAGGGESRAQVERRVRAALVDWVEGQPGLALAVVTHLGVLRALLPGRDLENAGCERIAGSELERRLESWR
jgi:broad specificity phosphatase PhoE